MLELLKRLSKLIRIVVGDTKKDRFVVRDVKTFSDNFQKPKKTFIWSTHICNTKCSAILSHSYSSVLANELDSHINILTADDLVCKFLNTSKLIGKDIKAFILSKFSR